MRMTARNSLVLATGFVFATLLLWPVVIFGQETPPPVHPESATQASPETEAGDLFSLKRLTGDWGGLRTDLEDTGISFSLTWQGIWQGNTRGGLETKNGNDFSNTYNLSLELDFGKMGLLPGASFFMEAQGTSGAEINDFDRAKIGGLSPTNANAGAEDPIFVNKYWYRQRLLDDRIEVRLGVIESFTDLIDVNNIAGSDDDQFLNSSLVGNPTIPHTIGMGAYLNVWPTDWLYARAMIADPAYRPGRTGFDTGFHGDDRVRTFWELGYVPQFEGANGTLGGHYRFGGWYHPRAKTIFRRTFGGLREPQSRSGDAGFFMNFDQFVWKENANENDKQGLSLFGRYGYAHGSVNRIEHFWSLGGQYVGLIPDRDDDVLGFGFAQAIQSRQFRHAIRPKADQETVFELYYGYHLTPWCVISPDLQLVLDPGGDTDDRDTFIVGLRVRIWF